MIIRVRGLRLPLEHSEKDIIEAVAERLQIGAEVIVNLVRVKQAVDARRREVYITLTLDVELEDQAALKESLLQSPEIDIVTVSEKPPIMEGERSLPLSPVIVGSGPAGLFCALFLARQGYRPVMIEQGPDMDRRVPAVEAFWQEGILNPLANTQFGEGGAGTFSDGKLTTRIGDQRVNYVLEAFVKHGAPEEILYLKKPHVGTDIVRRVVKRVRQEILDLGGEVYFNACLTDLSINNMSLERIVINNRVEIPCALLVLAVGNSARGVYRMLQQRGVQLLPKSFAVGLRVEHPQDFIDLIQYGDYAGHPSLGPADYHLTYQDRPTGRSMYTFCMCPGGYVIGSGSEPGQVVTNGMSMFARDSGIANSALVVTVTPSDWDNTPLGGMDLQQSLEERAFYMGGDSYQAPAQRLTDFMVKRTGDLEGSLATFRPGVTPANLWDLLPRPLGEVMERGLKYWNQKIEGFIHQESVLTGVETRTSAPLRIERNAQLHSVNVDNLYPCGEGAGYAGGIISAAVDGLRIAEQIITAYRRPGKMPDIEDNSIIRGRDLPRVEDQ